MTATATLPAVDAADAADAAFAAKFASSSIDTDAGSGAGGGGAISCVYSFFQPACILENLDDAKKDLIAFVLTISTRVDPTLSASRRIAINTSFTSLFKPLLSKSNKIVCVKNGLSSSLVWSLSSANIFP